MGDAPIAKHIDEYRWHHDVSVYGVEAHRAGGVGLSSYMDIYISLNAILPIDIPNFKSYLVFILLSLVLAERLPRSKR